MADKSDRIAVAVDLLQQHGLSDIAEEYLGRSERVPAGWIELEVTTYLDAPQWRPQMVRVSTIWSWERSRFSHVSTDVEDFDYLDVVTDQVTLYCHLRCEDRLLRTLHREAACQQ